ncbi:MAG: hypothetical protein ACUVQ0_03120 [Thermoproteota archaeon]
MEEERIVENLLNLFSSPVLDVGCGIRYTVRIALKRTRSLL